MTYICYNMLFGQICYKYYFVVSLTFEIIFILDVQLLYIINELCIMIKIIFYEK